MVSLGFHLKILMVSANFGDVICEELKARQFCLKGVVSTRDITAGPNHRQEQ